MLNILVCDDDREILDAIGIYLVHEGYEVYKASDGLEALELLNKHEIHLIVMDVMMPKMDGLKATIEIRKEKSIPIIILSAKSEDTDKIMGLNMGADDYMTKPFNPLEFLARVKSQLKRYTTLGSIEVKTNVYVTGGLVIDDEKKIVTVDGDNVRLTAVQYKILKLLTENAGRVYSIGEIYEKVWNEAPFNPENIVAVHIRNIREKIEISTKNPKYLKVVWGIGYKVEKL
ncbi:MAG: response regulator transcription factor [Alkaliphilus sp.]